MSDSSHTESFAEVPQEVSASDSTPTSTRVDAEIPSAPPIAQREEDLTPFLAAEPTARAALTEVAAATSIGKLVGSVPTDEGPVLLQFDCLLPGYPGWRWTAALGRPDADATPTVLEVELLPGDDSLISPPWRPWEERYAEYQAAHPQEDSAAEEDSTDDEDGDENSSEPDLADVVEFETPNDATTSDAPLDDEKADETPDAVSDDDVPRCVPNGTDS